ATLPVHYGLEMLGTVPPASATTGLRLAGVWAAHVGAHASGGDDPCSVVSGEVSLPRIALGIADSSVPSRALAALVLVPALVTLNPGVIDTAQRLRPAGLGIMADDVLAGLAAGALVHAAFLLVT